MSKIRNLFNKVLKKNKSDQDLDVIFSDEHDELEEYSETEEDSASFEDTELDSPPQDQPIMNDTNIQNEDDLDYPDIPEQEVMEAPPDQDSTGEIYTESYSDDEEYEDEDIDLDNFTSELHVGEVDDENHTSEIDLEDDKLSIRDKVDHLSTRVMDRFRSLNKKDLNQALKKETTSPTQGLKAIDKLKNDLQKVNYANIPNNFFKLANHSKYHRQFQMGTVVLTVLALGKITSSFIQGTPNYKKIEGDNSISLESDKNFTKDSLDQIKAANIFRTNIVKGKVDKKPNIQSPSVCKQASRKSSLPIKLVNTIVLQDSVKSIASVQVRSSSKLEVFREGQKINNMAKLDKITDEKLIIKNLKTGVCESIQSKAGKTKRKTNPIKTLSPRQSNKFKKEKKAISGVKNDGNNYEIQKSFLKEKMKDISSLLTQARGIQINNPDGSISFKVTEIDPGGIFAYLGLEDNDVITQINGEPIKDLNQVMTLFGTIANVSNLSLTSKRNGEEVQQNYTVK
jgi:type II secretory pathway component PulC